MKKFYDCGIDLGTTNSCIAVPNMDNTCTIIDNVADRMQVTPSVVWINNRGRIVIGQRAYTCINTQDVRKEFKRDMGSETVYEFPSSGVKKKPEELSAEILQSLRRDAESRTNKEMRDVVVTVPAAFSMVQCETTKKAAEIAGFRNVVLLQEPIAASIAYGAQPDAKDQYWLVFDYGGGTLDVSVISTVDGRLDNITSVGNNHMGGKDLDRFLYEKVILPKIQADYCLPNGLDENYTNLFLRYTESCKIELSSQNSSIFTIYDDVEDENGELIAKDYEITRDEFETAIMSEIAEAVSLAKEAVAKSGVNESQFTKIILVGGSTYVPLVKKKLTETLNITLDSSLNPMTVVAEGAALYAASMVISDMEDEITKSAGEYLVDLEYSAMTSEDKVNVIGRVLESNGAVSRVKIDCIATEDAESALWTSGWCNILNKDMGIFDVDVQICNHNCKNIYRISAAMEDGTSLPLLGYLFEIVHKPTALKLSQPPMPYAMGIMVTDGKDNRIDWLVEKDTKLPVSVTETYYLNKALVPSQKDVCEILIYEGDGKTFTYNPDANFLMRRVHINAEDLTRALEMGTKVDITIDIDENRCVTITGSVPMYGMDLVAETLSQYEENKVNYAIKMEQVERKLRETKNTIDLLKEKNIPLEGLETEFEEIKADFDKYYDLVDVSNDQVDQYIQRFFKLQTKIIKLERSSRDEVKNDDNDSVLRRIDNNIRTYGSQEQQAQYQSIRQQYDNAKSSDSKEFLLGKMDRLESEVVFNNIDFLKLIYLANYASSSAYSDMQKANYWKNMAQQALAENSKEKLLQAINNLSGLKIKTAGEAVRASLADLKK